jgi:hypothetical protein
VSESLNLVHRLLPAGHIHAAISKALSGLARETHQRIVESYEAECGGDWAIGPDDGYFVQNIAFHLVPLGRSAELVNNLDWLIRANRVAKDWWNALEDPSQAPRDTDPVYLESFFLGTEEAAFQTVTRMARKRSRLRKGPPSRRILVVGSGSYDLPWAVHTTAEAVGRELARWGFGLIGGGWQGVDYITADHYIQQLRSAEMQDDDGLLQIVPEGSRADFDGGIIQHVKRRDWERIPIERCDAVVVIGGLGGSIGMCRMAAKEGRPVFPIPGTGDDAATYYNEIHGADSPVFSRLDSFLDSHTAIYNVTRTLIELLLEETEPAHSRA